MKKINIIKNNIITNSGKFESFELAESWKLSNQHEFPQDYTYEIIDFEESIQTVPQVNSKIQAGKQAREICEAVLDYIAGENLNRQLTIEQITILQNTFSNAEAALRAGRPTFAKQYIQAITPDGDLVTQEMKDTALSILVNY